MSLKREIALLESEKSLEDLYHMIDVRLIGIHSFKGLTKRARRFDAWERLGNVLLDTMKHPSDNRWVGLRPRSIRWVAKWQRVFHEIMMKVVRLKKELKARSPCCVIIAGKIIGRPSKLCRD